MKTRIKTDEFIDDETGEYVKVKGLEKEIFSFYLKFIKEYFYPCNKCQEEIAEKFASPIMMHIEKYYTPVFMERRYPKKHDISFRLEFIGNRYTPCEECNKKLNHIIDYADEFIIGKNSNAIEFRRKWETVDNSWEEIERRKATKEDLQRIYPYSWSIQTST